MLSNEARIDSADGVSASATVTETVTQFAISRSADSIGYGQAETITVTGLPSNATGTVTATSLNPFGSGVIPLCNITLPASSCITGPALFPMHYALEAEWSGDSSYSMEDTTGPGFTVSQLTATVSASASPTTATYGEAVTLAATTDPPTGGVCDLQPGGVVLCTATTPATSLDANHAARRNVRRDTELEWRDGVQRRECDYVV